MTDWDLITEQIQNAMQAVDKAHEVSENLRNHATPDAFDEFKNQMQELGDHLLALQNVLDHTSTYAMDELVDALSRIQSGKRAAYRRTQHVES